MNEKILLFIPMYNCEKQIIRVLNQLHTPIIKHFTEIIIIDNRSTDNSQQAVISYLHNHSFSIPIHLLCNNSNYGLGGSHKVAFQYAIKNNFDYLVVLHGDDQGTLSDVEKLFHSRIYRKYDCCLGARFMKGSKIKGYSTKRILGNYGFNLLFSLVTRHRVYDLGSGLNLYSVKMLKNNFYINFPDTLYFNDCMILASSYYKHKTLYFPISWKEEDQVSNAKLWSFSLALLEMLYKYILNSGKFLHSDMRKEAVLDYSYTKIN